jgi:hypothetical protein
MACMIAARPGKTGLPGERGLVGVGVIWWSANGIRRSFHLLALDGRVAPVHSV